MQQVKFKKFKLSEINPAGYNPRVISLEALSGLTASLEKFGCVEPIIVNVRDKKNTIVGGHQRHKSLLETHGGDYEITCVVVDLSIEDEKLLNLALNNPEIQGNFIDGMDEYITQLKSEISQDDFYAMRINVLQAQIGQELGGIDIDMEKDQDNGLRLNYLTFDGNKIPLSDTELFSLNEKFKDYVDKYGSSYGFASCILGIEGEDA